jgi:hypothetical protein
MTILDTPIISRIRRNHGLEHATIHILSKRFPGRRIGGASDQNGFFIIGDLTTDDVHQSAGEALSRLEAGEAHLALHAGCGTNFVVAGFAAGFLAWLGLVGARSSREKVGRLPFIVALSMFGLILSRPFGPMVQQRITTSSDPKGLVIMDVHQVHFWRLVLHRVITRDPV